MSELSHNEIVDALTGVAMKVLPELLDDLSMPQLGEMTPKQTSEYLVNNCRHGVTEVLKRYQLPVHFIDEKGSWPPILERATQRQRRIFIALVLAIYNN